MAATPAPGEAYDLPLLGEPLPVELANALYDDEGRWIDFLADAAAATAWAAAVAEVHGVTPPAVLDADAAAGLRRLRDAVRAVVVALADDTVPPEEALAEVGRAAGAVPARPVLSWEGDVPSARVDLDGPDAEVLRARLAWATIDLATADDADRVRRCDGPGCPMLFVAHHGRRRFCHESCSHAARQLRYRRRQEDRR